MYGTRLRARVTGRGRPVATGPLPYGQYSSHVADLLRRISAADAAAGDPLLLETSVSDAISTCIEGLIADGILGVSGGALSQAASLIKAACFMMGARTLSGALVPLAADMPAPTNFNFVAGDYDRRNGITGNGSTKYLDTNYADDADPQDNAHLSVYATGAATGGANTAMAYASAGKATAPASFRAMARFNSFSGLTTIANYNRSGVAASGTNLDATGFLGNSRSASNSYTRRGLGVNNTVAAMSALPGSINILIFAEGRGAGSVIRYANCRLAFYSAGHDLDLAILDARITALSNAIQTAIAP